MAKTLDYSFMDVLLNPSTSKLYPESFTEAKTDLTYNTDYQSLWKDKYYNINLLETFGIADPSTWKYYGDNKYFYRFSLLNEASNIKTDQLLWDIIALF